MLHLHALKSDITDIRHIRHDFPVPSDVGYAGYNCNQVSKVSNSFTFESTFTKSQVFESVFYTYQFCKDIKPHFLASYSKIRLIRHRRGPEKNMSLYADRRINRSRISRILLNKH